MKRAIIVMLLVIALVIPVCASEGEFWTFVNATQQPAFRPVHFKANCNEPVVVGGRVIMLGVNYASPSNTTYYSDDGGVTWHMGNASAEFPARTSTCLLSHNGKAWIIGGTISYAPISMRVSFNDTWWSTDGILWHLENASAEFPKRWGGGAVSFNNKMWIIGGLPFWYSTTASFNDSWYSDDGDVWYKANQSIGIPLITSPRVTTFDNKIWILGGQAVAGSTYRNYTWWSDDGNIWYYGGQANWSARIPLTTFVYNNSIFLVGGGTSNGPIDIWKSSDGIRWSQINRSITPSPIPSPEYITATWAGSFVYGRPNIIGGYYTTRTSQVLTPQNQQWRMCDADGDCTEQLPYCAKSDVTSTVTNGVSDFIVIGLIAIVAIVFVTGVLNLMIKK